MFDTWLLYMLTIFVFMLTPGPSHLLMISVSMSNGFSKSLATAAGDLSANAIQIILAGFGLAAVIASSCYGFSVIKWFGVAYLLWIGIKTVLRSFSDNKQNKDGSTASVASLWFRGFITSAANPKAVVFFAALFPQFINTNLPLAEQILILGVSYIVVDGLFLTAYGLGADYLLEKLRGRYTALIERGGGIALIVIAVFLALSSSLDS